MKIAHISTVDISLRYLLLNQLKSLQSAGYEVVGISSPGPNTGVLQDANIQHIPITITRSLTPLQDLVSLWRLYRVLRREGFTIVHTHTPKPGLIGQLAARMAGVPIVINTIHGFYFHEHTPPFWRRFYITMEKIAGLCSDVILSQNSEDIETAIKEGICKPDKIRYLGNGIDVRRFDRSRLDSQMLAEKRRELGLPENVPVVGFVGRLVAEKGIPELLEAARIVCNRNSEVRFLFVGPIDREKADAISPELAKEYGIADRCIFTGMRQDMPYLYAMMNLFVLPSHREGFPRSPMEAASMGVPCVLTDIRGCREVVEPDRNGLLVPLKDSQALAEAMMELIGDPERARQLGENGRRKALEAFDEQRVFEIVRAEYQRLVREKVLRFNELSDRKEERLS